MMLNRQFTLFIGVGVVCALIDIAVAQSLIRSGLHYGLSVSVGFSLGLVVNYVLHSRLTFKSASSGAKIAKYAVVVLLNYLITMSLSYLAVQFTGDFLVGKIVSLPVIAVNGFILSRYWIFK